MCLGPQSDDYLIANNRLLISFSNYYMFTITCFQKRINCIWKILISHRVIDSIIYFTGCMIDFDEYILSCDSE